MNDFRDMLGAGPAAPAGARPAACVKPKKRTQHELQQELGVSREVLKLMGDAPPPILITSRPILKPSIRLAKVSGWKWAPFSNPARTDGLVLHHWVKAQDPDDGYRFSVFNKRADVVAYTDDEYEQHLADPAWTKPDTDHLFDLCRALDLRFAVILDRYDPPSGTARDMEDLKHRFVEVTRRILTLRHPLPDPSQKAVIASLQFDAAMERERKAHVRALMSRTQEEMDEEEQLLAELLMFEERHAKISKDRQEFLTRFYKGLDPHDLASYNTKRRKIREASYMNMHNADMNAAAAAAAKAEPAAPAVEGIVTTTDKLNPGVFLRTSKLTSVKPALQTKLSAILQEVGVRPLDRPVMCSTAVYQRFEELKANALQLLELKKQADKLESELRTFAHKRELYHSLDKRPTSSPAPPVERKRRR
ncbi:swr complex subunit [Blastocladiella emersonii ATCC 22665]|nr:swr complex subunit [Blastocladiella emersonii ATCC 22665]